ncbi:hypothetical protein BYT27DRAFT_7256185 [Phlegmacium glaucopus]|nr:hypothetical protein BYT27DRAFT_7256185 [Phlegmacium glaucopus]
MQHQDRLPSFAEVTASDKNDPSRLPSYREARRFRFHPYSRPIPVLVDEADRLLNTIYDDERVVLDVPPPLPAPLAVTRPLQPQAADEFEERLRRDMERAIAFELRVQRLSTVIVEFVAGITRATRG